jgi:sulfate permease, SulP family
MPAAEMIRIDMSVYFGSVHHIQQRLRTIADNERIYHVLIIASAINFIDLAGAEMLIAENEQLKKKGGGLYFAGLKPSVYEFAARSFFIRKIGPDRFFDSKTDAISSIYNRLDRDICAKCPALLFTECNE